MKYTFFPGNGYKVLSKAQIDGAHLTFTKWEGKRNSWGNVSYDFALVIPDEDTAEDFRREGYPVSEWIPADSRDAKPIIFINVKVNFKEFDRNGKSVDRGPFIYLQSGRNRVRLYKDTLDTLNNVQIESVDLDLSLGAYNEANPEKLSVYLQDLLVHQKVMDRFAESDEPVEMEEPLPFE